METAKEFIQTRKVTYIETYFEEHYEAMQAFAKYHVELALKKAAEHLPYDDKMNRDMFLVEKIENCYPLTNIK